MAVDVHVDASNDRSDSTVLTVQIPVTVLPVIRVATLADDVALAMIADQVAEQARTEFVRVVSAARSRMAAEVAAQVAAEHAHWDEKEREYLADAGNEA